MKSIANRNSFDLNIQVWNSNLILQTRILAACKVSPCVVLSFSFRISGKLQNLKKKFKLKLLKLIARAHLLSIRCSSSSSRICTARRPPTTTITTTRQWWTTAGKPTMDWRRRRFAPVYTKGTPLRLLASEAPYSEQKAECRLRRRLKLNFIWILQHSSSAVWSSNRIHHTSHLHSNFELWTLVLSCRWTAHTTS